VLQGQNTCRPEEGMGALSDHRGKGALELARSPHLDRMQCYLLGGQRIGSTKGDDNVYLETDQIGCKLRQSPYLPARESGLDGNVLPFDVPGRAVKQEPDSVSLPRWLRFGAKRRGQHPKRQPAEERAPADH
jgi:hypothetical protein